LAKLSLEGDGVFVLAAASSKDEDLGVRRACVGALLSYCEWGGREAINLLASAPSALQDLVECLVGRGVGEDSVRVLAAATSIPEGCKAALSCPNVLPNISLFLMQEAEALREQSQSPSRSHSTSLPPPPHVQPAALPALRALRALCTPDQGKTLAVSSGVVPSITAHLSNPSPLVRSAAAECLAVLSAHLPALQAFLDGQGEVSEGPSELASLLLPCLLDPSTRMSVGPALCAVCDSIRGREAVLGCALATDHEAVRLLCRILGGAKLSGDLLEVIKTPISDTFMKASALEGLKEIAILPGGPQQILQVPGVRQVLLALGTTEAKDVLEALEPPK